jgi:hypothetical protein
MWHWGFWVYQRYMIPAAEGQLWRWNKAKSLKVLRANTKASKREGQNFSLIRDSVHVNNQLDAQFFFRIYLFQFSTCFEHPCARAPLCSSSGELILVIWHLVYVSYWGSRQVCRFGWSSIQTCTLVLIIRRINFINMTFGVCELRRWPSSVQVWMEFHPNLNPLRSPT